MDPNNQEFQRLKQKYQPALTLMQQLQVRVHNINMDNNKLFIRGTAPSADVKNKVWDQIKLIDASYSDLICDLIVSQQQSQQPTGQAAATMSAGASASGGQGVRYYTVKPGDTLSKISREVYGAPNQFRKIFNANRNVLADPDKI